MVGAPIGWLPASIDKLGIVAVGKLKDLREKNVHGKTKT